MTTTIKQVCLCGADELIDLQTEGIQSFDRVQKWEQSELLMSAIVIFLILILLRLSFA